MSEQHVTDPNTYQLFNNQVKYAAERSGPSGCSTSSVAPGNVYYQRGFAGAGADNDRHTGFTNVLKDYPNIKVLPEQRAALASQWDPANVDDPGHQRLHRQR